MDKGLGASLASSCQPWADGSFGDAQRLGNLALRPAVVLELPGL
jgi:hypothetical protein